MIWLIVWALVCGAIAYLGWASARRRERARRLAERHTIQVVWKPTPHLKPGCSYDCRQGRDCTCRSVEIEP